MSKKDKKGKSLKEYLDFAEISPEAFAGQIEISANTIRSILDGRTPSLRVALKIEDFTHGIVTCKCLIPEEK